MTMMMVIVRRRTTTRLAPTAVASSSENSAPPPFRDPPSDLAVARVRYQQSIKFQLVSNTPSRGIGKKRKRD